MPHLAFCSNCGSDDLRIGSRTSVGIEVTCYRCTKKTVLAGIMNTRRRTATVRVLKVREAVYDGAFDVPKTDAGRRQVPLSEAALRFIGEWKGHAGKTEAESLVFSKIGRAHV